jgi:hypothetical protein
MFVTAKFDCSLHVLAMGYQCILGLLKCQCIKYIFLWGILSVSFCTFWLSCSSLCMCDSAVSKVTDGRPDDWSFIPERDRIFPSPLSVDWLWTLAKLY